MIEWDHFENKKCSQLTIDLLGNQERETQKNAAAGSRKVYLQFWIYETQVWRLSASVIEVEISSRPFPGPGLIGARGLGMVKFTALNDQRQILWWRLAGLAPSVSVLNHTNITSSTEKASLPTGNYILLCTGRREVTYKRQD